MQRDRPLKILILGLNYAPEIVGIAVYTVGLATALVERGHSVAAVVGKPYYPQWSVAKDYRGGLFHRSVEDGVRVTRVAHYVPASPTGARRLVHHASFLLSSILPMLAEVWRHKPDVVLTVAPSLIAAPVARVAAWLGGAKSWLHIQDFEVEAAFATKLIRSGRGAAKAALWYERILLRSFDRVSSISPAMCNKCREKGIEPSRVYEFRNWAAIDEFVARPGPETYRAELGITAPYVALYSGNIANKQGIEIIVAAAKRLRHRHDLTFVICGQGPNRGNLEAQAAGLTNVIFCDLQPKARLAEFIGIATVHLLPQLASAADLVLPSKLTNMLASGRPIIATADPSTGLGQEVAGCGVLVPPEDDEAFATAIGTLLDDEPLRHELGHAAAERADERWRRDPIIDRFEMQLQVLRNSA